MASDIAIIFDLDQTLIDSSLAEQLRKARNWDQAYSTIPRFALYPGIEDVLKFISEEQITYCIVTSSPSSYCVKVCSHWKIKSSFNVCYHDTGRSEQKPHPAPIMKAIGKLRISPDRILSFGDSEKDILSSSAAKVHSVACLWGTADKKTLIDSKPSFIIAQPSEMIPLIKEFRASFSKNLR